MPPSIEELIQQATGKSFQEMSDEELIDLVNNTRNCYQILNQAAQARKERRRSEPKAAKIPIDWDAEELVLELDLDEETA